MRHPMYAARIKQPVFERRHYRMMATLLKWEHVAICDCPLANKAWEHMKDAMANMFAADNPRFNRGRFEEACNP